MASLCNHPQKPDDDGADIHGLVEFNNEERLAALQEYRSTEPYQAALQRIELARAAKVFEELKRERGVIDFADQISLALRVAEEYPEVAKDVRSRFAAVVLDEYQ